MLKRWLLVAMVSASALLAPSAAKPLIGGEPTGAASYTNVGAFGVIRGGAFHEICSGTLITPNVVLTAGHCTFFFEDQSSLDIVFTLDPSPTATSTVYDATAFYTHPDYVDRLNGNSKCGLYGQCTTDIGLVELASASTGATSATIAPLDYVDTLDLKTQTFNIA